MFIKLHGNMKVCYSHFFQLIHTNQMYSLLKQLTNTNNCVNYWFEFYVATCYAFCSQCCQIIVLFEQLILLFLMELGAVKLSKHWNDTWDWHFVSCFMWVMYLVSFHGCHVMLFQRCFILVCPQLHTHSCSIRNVIV